MTQNAILDKEAKAEALKARSKALDEKEAKANEGRTGIGLRVFYAMSRGKNSQEVNFEAFNPDDSGTWPESVSQFTDLTKTTDAKTLMSYLVSGHYDAAYSSASDPLAEYVDSSWPPALQKTFKQNLKSLVDLGVDVEKAVAAIKPQIEALVSAVK